MAMSIDTVSVNWGIAKLTHAFDGIAPTLSGLTHEYVQYMVTQQVVWSASWGLLAALLFFGAIAGFIFSVRNDTNESMPILSVLSFISSAVSVIIFITQLSNLILALKYPTIFAIMHTVK